MAARDLMRMLRTDGDMEKKLTAATEFVKPIIANISLPGGPLRDVQMATSLLPALRYLLEWTQASLGKSTQAVPESFSRSESSPVSGPGKKIVKRRKLGKKREGEGEVDNTSVTLPPCLDVRYWTLLRHCIDCIRMYSGQPWLPSLSPGLLQTFTVVLRVSAGRLGRGNGSEEKERVKESRKRKEVEKDVEEEKEKEEEVLAGEMAYLLAAVLSGSESRWGLEQWLSLCQAALQHKVLHQSEASQQRGEGGPGSRNERAAEEAGQKFPDRLENRRRVALIAVEGFGRFITVHPNPRKAFIGVIDRLLVPLLNAKIALERCCKDTWHYHMTQAVEKVLEVSLFHEAHIGDYSSVCRVPWEKSTLKDELSAASLMKKLEMEETQRVETADGGVGREEAEKSRGGKGEGTGGRSYLLLLFNKIEAAMKIGDIDVTQSLPWLLETFARHLAKKGRVVVEPVERESQSEVVDEDDHVKTGGKKTDGESSKNVNQRGGRRDVLFRVLTHLLTICISTSKERVLIEGNPSHVAIAIETIGTLLIVARKTKAYVPVEDSEGHHLGFLTSLGKVIVRIGQGLISSCAGKMEHAGGCKLGVRISEGAGRSLHEGSNSGEEEREGMGKAVMGALAELLQLEHRAVEEHLSELWPLLLNLVEKKEGEEEDGQEGKDGTLWWRCIVFGCTLIQVYSDLRQVERAVISLLDALHAFPSFGKAAALLAASSPLQTKIGESVEAMPPGQVAPLLRRFAEYLPFSVYHFAECCVKFGAPVASLEVEKLQNERLKGINGSLIAYGGSFARKGKGGKSVKEGVAKEWEILKESEALAIAVSEIFACVINHVQPSPANAVQIGNAVREIAFSSAGQSLKPFILKWGKEGSVLADFLKTDGKISGGTGEHLAENEGINIPKSKRKRKERLEKGEKHRNLDSVERNHDGVVVVREFGGPIDEETVHERGGGGEQGSLPQWLSFLPLRTYLLAKGLHKHSCTLMPPVASLQAMTEFQEGKILTASDLEGIAEPDFEKLLCDTSPFAPLMEEPTRVSHAILAMAQTVGPNLSSSSPMWHFLAASVAVDNLDRLNDQIRAISFCKPLNDSLDTECLKETTEGIKLMDSSSGTKSSLEDTGKSGQGQAQKFLRRECEVLATLVLNRFSELVDRNINLESCSWTGQFSSLSEESCVVAHMKLLCDSSNLWVQYSPLEDLQGFVERLIRIAIRRSASNHQNGEVLLTKTEEGIGARSFMDMRNNVESKGFFTAISVAQEAIFFDTEFYEEQAIREVWASSWVKEFEKTLHDIISSVIPTSSVSDLPNLLQNSVSAVQLKREGKEMRMCIKRLNCKYEREVTSGSGEAENITETKCSFGEEDGESKLNADVSGIYSLLELLRVLVGLPKRYLLDDQAGICVSAIGRAERCLLAGILHVNGLTANDNIKIRDDLENVFFSKKRTCLLLLRGLSASRGALAFLSSAVKGAMFKSTVDQGEFHGDDKNGDILEGHNNTKKIKWVDKAMALEWLMVSVEASANCFSTFSTSTSTGTGPEFDDSSSGCKVESMNEWLVLESMIHSTFRLVNGQCTSFLESPHLSKDTFAGNPAVSVLVVLKEKVMAAFSFLGLPKKESPKVSLPTILFVPRTVMLSQQSLPQSAKKGTETTEKLKTEPSLGQKPVIGSQETRSQLPSGSMYRLATGSAVICGCFSSLYSFFFSLRTASKTSEDDEKLNRLKKLLRDFLPHLELVESTVADALSFLLGVSGEVNKGRPLRDDNAVRRIGHLSEESLTATYILEFWGGDFSLSDFLLQGQREAMEFLLVNRGRNTDFGKKLCCSLFMVAVADALQLRSLLRFSDKGSESDCGNQEAREQGENQGENGSREKLSKLPPPLVSVLSSILGRVLFLLTDVFPGTFPSVSAGRFFPEQTESFLMGPLAFLEAVGAISQHCEPKFSLKGYIQVVDCHLHLWGILRARSSNKSLELGSESGSELRSKYEYRGESEKEHSLVKEADDTKQFEIFRLALRRSFSALVRGSSRARLREMLKRLEAAVGEVLEVVPEGQQRNWASGAVEAFEVLLEAVSGPKKLGLLATRCPKFTASLLQWLGNTVFCVGRSQLIDVYGTSVECALGILTTIASREAIFPMTSSHVALALDIPCTIIAPFIQGNSSDPFFNSGFIKASAGRQNLQASSNILSGRRKTVSGSEKENSKFSVIFVGCCRLLCALVRHRPRDVRRCAAILGASLRTLLQVLSEGNFRSWGTSEDSEKCATWLRRGYEEMAEQKQSLSKYCVHTLADYITAVAAQLQISTGLSREVNAVVRSGAYALMDASSPQDLQHLHAALGSESLRKVLSELKHDYDRYHKFTGKV